MTPDPWDSEGFTATVSRNGAAAQGPTPEPFKLKTEPTKPVNPSPPPGFDPSMPMPWGKHKGTPVGKVPSDYMQWCLKNADSMNQELRQAFEFMANVLVGSTKPAVDPPKSEPWQQRYGVRGTQAEKPRAVAPPAAQISSIRGLVKSWYGKMSRRFHPDLGGSTAQQIVLNTCYKTLCEEIERWEKQ